MIAFHSLFVRCINKKSRSEEEETGSGSKDWRSKEVSNGLTRTKKKKMSDDDNDDGRKTELKKIKWEIMETALLWIAFIVHLPSMCVIHWKGENVHSLALNALFYAAFFFFSLFRCKFFRVWSWFCLHVFVYICSSVQLRRTQETRNAFELLRAHNKLTLKCCVTLIHFASDSFSSTSPVVVGTLQWRTEKIEIKMSTIFFFCSSTASVENKNPFWLESIDSVNEMRCTTKRELSAFLLLNVFLVCWDIFIPCQSHRITSFAFRIHNNYLSALSTYG